MSWAVVPFGELADFRNGLNYSRENFGTGLKIISVGNFGARRIPDLASLDEINPDGIAKPDDYLSDGDLLFVRSNGNRDLVGRAMLMTGIGAMAVGFSGFCIRARFTNDGANPAFYAYLFRAPLVRHQLTSGGVGANIANVSQKSLARLKVPLPPKDEQDAIVATLSAYDDLIATNQRRMALLEDAARRLYREWFVHLRFPGCESVPVKDGIPAGWKKGNAYDFVSILSGGTPKTGVEHYWGGDIPFFTPKDSPDAYYVLGTEKTLTEAGLASCNSRLFAKDTTFITARGTVGKVALSQKPMAMNQSCYALVPKQEYDKFFLFAAVKDAIEHFKQVAVGGVFDAIVVDTFKIIPFVLPDAAVTRAFGNAVSPIFQQVEILLLQNTQLAQARDRLLPKLMSGQIDVSNIPLPEVTP